MAISRTKAPRVKIPHPHALGTWRRRLRLPRWVPAIHLNFFRLHVLVGLTVPPVVGAIFWASSADGNPIRYIDAVFMCCSAISLTGLQTILIADLTTWQQFILYALATIGSWPFVAGLTLLVRRYKFSRRLKHDLQNGRLKGNTASAGRGTSARKSGPIPTRHESECEDSGERNGRAENGEGGAKLEATKSPAGGAAATPGGLSQQPFDPLRYEQLQSKKRRAMTMKQRKGGRGGFPNPLSRLLGAALGIFSDWHAARSPRTRSGFEPEGGSTGLSRRRTYLPFDIDEVRNSRFRNLTPEKRRLILEAEIQSMSILACIYLAYWALMQLVTVAILGPYFASGAYASSFSENPGVNKTWFSFFQVASFFNNFGLSLVDTSLTTFQSCAAMLIPAMFLIFGGNMCMPVFLRLAIWITAKLAPKRYKPSLQFILDHPRRVTFAVFPSYETWALFGVACALTLIDWGLFFLLDIGNQDIYGLKTSTAVMDGLLQSFSVRAAGFYAFNLYDLAPALHVTYIFMMIFAIYPLAMAIRATNVYEERALGITDDDEYDLQSGFAHLHRQETYIKIHVRHQLAYDIWWLIFAIWLIAIIERHNIENPTAPWFNLFAIIFECCSAYGNVGFSLSNPAVNTSFSSSLRKLSKLVICAVMIRARTRGLPVEVDRAIMTPAELDKHGDPPECDKQETDTTQAAEEATREP